MSKQWSFDKKWNLLLTLLPNRITCCKSKFLLELLFCTKIMFWMNDMNVWMYRISKGHCPIHKMIIAVPFWNDFQFVESAFAFEFTVKTLFVCSLLIALKVLLKWTFRSGVFFPASKPDSEKVLSGPWESYYE